MSWKHRMAAATLLLVTGCVHARVDVREQLFEADRAFARATAKPGARRVAVILTEDAVRFSMSSEVHRGLEAIRAFDGPNFADPSIRLRWEPDVAGGFGAGDHGYTRGRYQVVRVADDGSETKLSEGTYLSFWQRTASGAWKVLLDAGVADRERSE